MSLAKTTNAASVRARLLNVAKAQGVDFQQVLVRFALERILYRLKMKAAQILHRRSAQKSHTDTYFDKVLRGLVGGAWAWVMPNRETVPTILLKYCQQQLKRSR